MDVDDFQNLYKLLRGSRSAMAVLDARALFSEKKLADAHSKLAEARQSFAESRARVLKQDPEKQVDSKAKDRDRQLKKAKRKQDKAQETLDAFDELLPALAKAADRQQQRQARAEEQQQASAAGEGIDLDSGSDFDSSDGSSSSSERADNETQQPPARSKDVTEEFLEQFAQCNGDEHFDLIGQSFGFREVGEESELLGDAVYFIQTGGKTLLVSTAADVDSEVSMVNLADGRSIKPIPRAAFLKLGRKRKMVLLTLLSSADRGGNQGEEEPQQSAESAAPTSEEDAEAEPKRNALDMGAFSQLLSAAQRSGLVSGADQIGHVRDREFRMGKYDQAFQAIDSMFSRFSASASQRIQRLAREDADISSGRIKMSPKDLQAKRMRDRAQTAEVERAKRRFQVVLEGLRILMNTEGSS